jgi:hypothetical protein
MIPIPQQVRILVEVLETQGFPPDPAKVEELRKAGIVLESEGATSDDFRHALKLYGEVTLDAMLGKITRDLVAKFALPKPPSGQDMGHIKPWTPPKRPR